MAYQDVVYCVPVCGAVIETNRISREALIPRAKREDRATRYVSRNLLALLKVTVVHETLMANCEIRFAAPSRCLIFGHRDDDFELRAQWLCWIDSIFSSPGDTNRIKTKCIGNAAVGDSFSSAIRGWLQKWALFWYFAMLWGKKKFRNSARDKIDCSSVSVLYCI